MGGGWVDIYLEGLDGNGEGSREEADLAVGHAVLEEPFQDGLWRWVGGWVMER